MGFKRRVITYEPIEVEASELVPVSEAARLTGLSMSGVISAIERGTLTEIINDEAWYHGRRLLLRSEVDELIRARGEQGQGQSGVRKARPRPQPVRGQGKGNGAAWAGGAFFSPTGPLF